jgi:hypothetical protein
MRLDWPRACTAADPRTAQTTFPSASRHIHLFDSPLTLLRLPSMELRLSVELRPTGESEPAEGILIDGCTPCFNEESENLIKENEISECVGVLAGVFCVQELMNDEDGEARSNTLPPYHDTHRHTLSLEATTPAS